MNTTRSWRVRRRALLASGLGWIAGPALAQPAPALPSAPAAAFAAQSLAAARAALGATGAQPGDAIRLDAPEIVADPGAVAVAVWTALANVQQVALLVEQARFPLAALLRPAGATPPFSVTVDLTQTARVHALVQAGGTWYAVAREIKLAARRW